MAVLHEVYAPGADTGSEMLAHAGEEGGIVVNGRIEVTVGGQTQVLGPGDAYYFSSRFRTDSAIAGASAVRSSAPRRHRHSETEQSSLET